MNLNFQETVAVFRMKALRSTDSMAKTIPTYLESTGLTEWLLPAHADLVLWALGWDDPHLPGIQGLRGEVIESVQRLSRHAPSPERIGNRFNFHQG